MHIFLNSNKKEEKFLREKLPPLDFSKENKKDLRDLSRVMRKAMREANGIGLSANQIGIAKRIFVAEVPDNEGRLKFYFVVNPKITKLSKGLTDLEEGCLSVPGKYGFVSRSEKIVLEGLNIQGKKLKIKAWGLLARVFEHEVDHLDGKLFVDKAKELRNIEKEK